LAKKLFPPLSLEEWVEYKGFEDLKDEWYTHLEVYGIVGVEADQLVRLLFISLRDKGTK
jgi:hypothetical protein